MCRFSQGSSPHTRGARANEPRHRRRQRIIPAYAGSTWPRGPDPSRVPDHPRIRGEHRRLRRIRCDISGSSPHTRGALDDSDQYVIDGRIIPAYAGSTGGKEKTRGCITDHPRIRGEHETHRAGNLPSSGSSPHTRGAPPGYQAIAVGVRIIPAYAGSTSPWRTRQTKKMGSSPHTRGAPVAELPALAQARIIPAYAGSTSLGCAPLRPSEDHPRIRGEHSVPEAPPRAFPGSSPHTRGARGTGRRGTRGAGIIPAYAGSTRVGESWTVRHRDHPRIRGEHSSPSTSRSTSWGSSPHTRGARLSGECGHSGVGIIPAYAGSTRLWRPCRRRPWDHPRIRGEHIIFRSIAAFEVGSSPHTRGAHLEIPAIPRIAAVIIPVFLYPSPTPQEEADRSMVLLTLS